MLISPVILAIAHLSALSERLLAAAATTKPSPNGSPFTPEEPTTLTLALIGIGIIAAYVAVRRRFRLRRGLHQTSVPPGHANVARIETPTRGAA